MLDQSELHGGGFRCTGQTNLQVPAAWRQPRSTGVPSAAASTHFAFASASHRGAAASSTRSVGASSWRLPLQRQIHLQVPTPDGKQSPAVECQRQGRARALSPPTPHNVQQAQARLNQLKLHGGGFRCKATPTCRCLAWRQARSTRVPAAETSTHLESAPVVHRASWSSRKLARSVGASSWRRLPLHQAHSPPAGAWCLAASTLLLSASGRDEYAP